MIIHLATKEIMSQSNHPDDNWMGGEWELIPKHLEWKALKYAPFILLERDADGGIADIISDEQARKAWEEEQAQTVPEPTTEDYLVDLDFRVSLIELGVN